MCINRLKICVIKNERMCNCKNSYKEKEKTGYANDGKFKGKTDNLFGNSQ